MDYSSSALKLLIGYGNGVQSVQNVVVAKLQQSYWFTVGDVLDPS